MKFLNKFAAYAALSLVVMSTSAQAALMSTTTQNQTYTGVAGNASNSPGLQPFVFEKFDTTLGTLLRVVARLSLTISGGLISADNMTNQVASGTGMLGAQASVSGPVPFINDQYAPMFSGFELAQYADFTLAADPTMSFGGNGPDVGTLYGGTYNKTSGWQSVASLFNYAFVGAGDLLIDFDTNSDISIDVVGARGSFEAVNAVVSLDLFYEYETIDVTPPSAVNAGYGMAGLAFLLLGFRSRRKSSF